MVQPGGWATVRLCCVSSLLLWWSSQMGGLPSGCAVYLVCCCDGAGVQPGPVWRWCRHVVDAWQISRCRLSHGTSTLTEHSLLDFISILYTFPFVVFYVYCSKYFFIYYLCTHAVHRCSSLDTNCLCWIHIPGYRHTLLVLFMLIYVSVYHVFRAAWVYTQCSY